MDNIHVLSKYLLAQAICLPQSYSIIKVAGLISQNVSRFSACLNYAIYYSFIHSFIHSFSTAHLVRGHGRVSWSVGGRENMQTLHRKGMTLESNPGPPWCKGTVLIIANHCTTVLPWIISYIYHYYLLYHITYFMDCFKRTRKKYHK